ncbi:MAG: TetR/AcrR family transcriptional regulator [Oscillibacter sp.]|jgi:AcrR family transcriptional regulator|nr:TetR/AcrR family transcriptional regulator [Oscillibacter sp.]
MEKMTRKEKSAATKEKIFSTAAELIKQKGYDHVTVSEICSNAGIAKGSFYVHYHSKEDIIRESYYADLGTYLKNRYTTFLQEVPAASGCERIFRFLSLELEFAEFAGYELTCLAYMLNLGTCIPGPSEHLQKRDFSRILYQEIVNCMDEAHTDFSAADVFAYFESMVRGIMATWCFSNHEFSMKNTGNKFLAYAVRSIFPSFVHADLQKI